MADAKQYERLMSRILQLGVVTSSVLMGSGLLAVSLQSTPVAMPERNPMLGELLRRLVSGQSGEPVGITLMFAGLVVLMLTPFLRVITTLEIFRAQRDWKFVGIAAVVLLLLAGQVVYSLY